MLVWGAAALAGELPPRAEKAPELNPVLADLPVVEAAALHVQTLEEAPANVSVVTADDIRTYGYRTLGEALSSVRGFFGTYDHVYQYFGVRGLAALPGDYNTRFLVMLNGHPLTDNVYDSNNFFGQDFGLDMDLVSRIEIVRGPTSALYGTNGILATINVVTKSPVNMDRVRATTEFGSFGEKKAGISSSIYLGGGANLLLSGSVFNNAGATMEFRPNGGVRTPGVDGERGYHGFGNLVWRNWSFTGLWASRQKAVPIPWGDAALDLHPGTWVLDGRNFVSSSYSRPVGRNATLQWQLYFDQTVYDDRFDYPEEDELHDVRSLARGEWVGTQLTWRQSLGRYGDLTGGGQFDFDIRNLQQNIDFHPVYRPGPRMDHRDQRQAAFLQEEYSLGKRWTACLGLRLDHSWLYGSFLSPRVALVYQASPATTWKFVTARPFRRPSAFERFYEDGGESFVASPDLRPEKAITAEVSYERRVRPWLSAVVNAYFYRMSDVIAAEFLPGDVEQYRNGPHSRVAGFEGEINARSARGLEAGASYSYLQVAQVSGDRLVNSPAHIGKARSAWRPARGRFSLAASAQAVSPRMTRTGAWTRSVFLLDLTAGTLRLHPQFDLEMGVRNLAGWRYQDPVALAYDRVPARGRSVWLKLIWHLPE